MILMMTWMWAGSPVHAKGMGWFQTGAGSVSISGPTDFPLVRGPATDFRPALEVSLGEGAGNGALAIVDIAGGWNRIGEETAAALGITWEFTQRKGTWVRIAEVPSLSIGEAITLSDVHLEVVERPGLVLGMQSLDELAVAILPSEGVIRLVPAKSDGAELVASLGDAVEAKAQSTKAWTANGTTFRGNGLTLGVPGALIWGVVTEEGTFHIRTDEPNSLVAKSSRLPQPLQRAGNSYHDVGARLGEIDLDKTWIREDITLSDPAPDFYAALGYDVLYRIDLAVSARDGTVSFREVTKPQWTDSTELAVKLAKDRFKAREKRAARNGEPTSDQAEERVKIGFQGPNSSDQPLGDPGVPEVRDRNLDVAEALWQAGALDEAMPHYFAAASFAGDHCATHLELGQRRLRWSGVMQERDYVLPLVEQPIQRTARIWDTWLSLDQATRDVIWSGKNLPEGTLQVYQPQLCSQARGLLLASRIARGDEAGSNELINRYPTDPGVLIASSSLKLQKDPVEAQRLVTRGLEIRGEAAVPKEGRTVAEDELDVRLALARAYALRLSPTATLNIVQDVPGYESDHPLTAALTVLQIGLDLEDKESVFIRLGRTDSRWTPGLLAKAIAFRNKPDPWDEKLEWRQPGAPQVACLKAVHLAASGDIPGAKKVLSELNATWIADFWAASAAVAALDGDRPTFELAVKELQLRFPQIPVGQLGLGPTLKKHEPPPPPPPEPKRRRRRR